MSAAAKFYLAMAEAVARDCTHGNAAGTACMECIGAALDREGERRAAFAKTSALLHARARLDLLEASLRTAIEQTAADEERARKSERRRG
jgi:hypothetical protein